MSTPTAEQQEAQIAKLAAACEAAASRGFITHLKTAGVDDKTIARYHAKYASGRENYAGKLDAMRTTILENLAK